jgi:hypothetical protein
VTDGCTHIHIRDPHPALLPRSSSNTQRSAHAPKVRTLLDPAAVRRWSQSHRGRGTCPSASAPREVGRVRFAGRIVRTPGECYQAAGVSCAVCTNRLCGPPRVLGPACHKFLSRGGQACATKRRTSSDPAQALCGCCFCRPSARPRAGGRGDTAEGASWCKLVQQPRDVRMCE